MAKSLYDNKYAPITEKDHRMDTPEHDNTPPAPTRTADPRLLRGLQGEDGYEIFNDDTTTDACQRLRLEQEDNRW